MPTFSSARLRFLASSRVNAFWPNSFNLLKVSRNSGSDSISFNVSGTKEEEDEEARVEFFLDDDDDDDDDVRPRPIAHLTALKLVDIVIINAS